MDTVPNVGLETPDIGGGDGEVVTLTGLHDFKHTRIAVVRLCSARKGKW